MKKLFSCEFGSSLYGTKTPTSDLDMKHVILPDIRDILIGTKISNVVKKTNIAKNVRNSVDDVDEEFIPIQIFARDFMMGQTYAIELAFSIEGDHAGQTVFDPRGSVVRGTTVEDRGEYFVKCRDVNFEEWDYETPLFVSFVKELREKFLTSNIKSMMGYVVNQASLYSFKGERLNVAKEFMEILEYVPKYNVGVGVGLGQGVDMSLTTLHSAYTGTQNFRDSVDALAKKYPKYFNVTEYDIGAGRMKPALTLLEKTLPFTNSLEKTMEVVDALIKRYGSRAAAASDTNVDWKATTHALRIVDEGLQLLSDHELTFPFEPDYVKRLLSIKRGEVPLKEVTEELTMKLDRLKQLEQETNLPAYNQEMREEFDKWLSDWMIAFYF